MIAIVDYGIGNIMSLMHALEDEDVILTSAPEVLRVADAIILPGVGAFGYAMAELESLQLVSVLKELNDMKKKIVGICLGMQLFYESSEEYGKHQGLGLLKGEIKILPNHVKKPHMGWNRLKLENKDCRLTKGVVEGDFTYFVHSYYAASISPETVVASTSYGLNVPAIIQHDNLIGYQFHPEKSGIVGKKLVKNLRECLR